MPNYGVIDLGSNTIRLVIFEVKDNTLQTYTNKDFKSLLNDKVMAGLSAYVSQGIFSDAGIDKAVSVLKGHMKRAHYFKCVKLEVFATAVLRNAHNSAEAIARIEERTGLSLVLLSEEDEAHLGFVGATCDRYVEQGTLVDIGGGSTELTRIYNGSDFNNTSIGQGSLSSFKQHVHEILPTEEEMQSIAFTLRSHLSQLPHLATYRCNTLFGIGGSARAAAKMLQQMYDYKIRPKTITKQEIHEILNQCSKDPALFAHRALKASAERIHTLVPGCVILYTLLEELHATEVAICKYGVREGYLIDRILS